MRKCKYFMQESWCYTDPWTRKTEKASTIKCLMGQLPYVWNGVGEAPCCTGNPPCHTPVELDPYWKDIFNETNKRLYNINSK